VSLIRLQGGKPILEDGKVGTAEACCCGEEEEANLGACCDYFCAGSCLFCEWQWDGVDTLLPLFDVNNPPQANACPTGDCFVAQCPNQPLLDPGIPPGTPFGARVSESYCCNDLVSAVCFENVAEEDCTGLDWILNGVCGGGSGSTNKENYDSCIEQVFP
jgi:hypothetical protein